MEIIETPASGLRTFPPTLITEPTIPITGSPNMPAVFKRLPDIKIYSFKAISFNTLGGGKSLVLQELFNTKMCNFPTLLAGKVEEYFLQNTCCLHRHGSLFCMLISTHLFGEQCNNQTMFPNQYDLTATSQKDLEASLTCSNFVVIVALASEAAASIFSFKLIIELLLFFSPLTL